MSKVKRKLTFDLEVELEKELYELLGKHTGAGVDLLAEHFRHYKNAINRVKRAQKEALDGTANKEDNTVSRLAEVVKDPELLFDKIEEAKKSNNKLIVHIVDGEVLTEDEYQRRVWRPHYELNNKKREEISDKLYKTTNPDIKRSTSLELTRRFNSDGTKRTADEVQEYRESIGDKGILDTFMNK